MGMGINEAPDERTLSNANDPEKLEAVQIYAFALKQYQKFLQGVKGHILSLSKEEGRWMAMISCLLVFSIETIQFRNVIA
jgi:hypothetical protein